MPTVTSPRLASSQLFEVTSTPVKGMLHPVPLLVHCGRSKLSADDLNGVSKRLGSSKLDTVKEVFSEILQDGRVVNPDIVGDAVTAKLANGLKRVGLLREFKVDEIDVKSA